MSRSFVSNQECVLRHLSTLAFLLTVFPERVIRCANQTRILVTRLHELFLAPSLRLLSRLLFILVLAGTLSEFGCGFEALGSEKTRGPGNSFNIFQTHETKMRYNAQTHEGKLSIQL